MKISELYEGMWDHSYLNGLLHELGDNDVTNAINKRRSLPNHEYVSSGANAYVGRTNDPHHLDTVERTAPDEDVANFYLAYLAANNSAQTNKFLPRVTRDPTSLRGVPTFHMEKLVPLTDRRFDHPDLIKAVWEQYFTVPPPVAASASSIASMINRIAVLGDFRLVKSPQLRAAIELITAIKEHSHAVFDLHDGNMMWRVTGTMPQLVFTDPISVGSSQDA